jgi:hypothetical protein
MLLEGQVNVGNFPCANPSEIYRRSKEENVRELKKEKE